MSANLVVQKIQKQQHQLQQHQFIYDLDPRTLLSIDMAAPVVSKTPSTFRVDVTRRPHLLPRLTRIGRRVFVRVSDLLDFISPTPKQQAGKGGV